MPATDEACWSRERTWARSRTNVSCLESSGGSRASAGPVSTRASWRSVVAGQRGQPPQRRHPLGPGGVRVVQHAVGPVDGTRPDPRHLGRGRAQVLDRAELAAEHGHDVERGQHGRVQQVAGRLERASGRLQRRRGRARHDVGNRQLALGLLYVGHAVAGVEDPEGEVGGRHRRPHHDHAHHGPHDPPPAPPAPPGLAPPAHRHRGVAVAWTWTRCRSPRQGPDGTRGPQQAGEPVDEALELERGGPVGVERAPQGVRHVVGGGGTHEVAARPAVVQATQPRPQRARREAGRRDCRRGGRSPSR